jgi:hypothetical protein
VKQQVEYMGKEWVVFGSQLKRGRKFLQLFPKENPLYGTPVLVFEGEISSSGEQKTEAKPKINQKKKKASGLDFSDSPKL